MITPQEIIHGIKQYHDDVDEALIKNAYIFALDRHGTQVRESGEPFFLHPLKVAEILISLKMDQKTIVSGLLHDTVEDTSATIEEIQEKFGEEIAKIVNGVTKLSKFEESDLALRQTESFKKLLLSSAADIRVLIIKLADRLHNMRTIKYKKKKAKRQALAKETMQIYAPLAERIGILNIQEELQDLSFQELYPEIYSSIKEKLKNLYDSSEEIINKITEELKGLSTELEISSSVSGRLKTPYSIWQKMNVRGISFEQLSDVMAFRIIVDSVHQCYQMLGAVHRKFMVVPGRFRDYISTPKNNSYQSLHTSVIGPLNKRIEVQIRTQEMHEIAEYGIAAHWNYKEGGDIEENKKNSAWLKNLVMILENTSGMEEFMENSKTEMFSDHVFCLTPRGKIISLPKGASALDFAYAIHSDVGNHASGAKINGQVVPLKTLVDNGDQIEIMIDRNQVPKPYWENSVITVKAKANIRKALNGVERERIEMIGKSNFYEFFKNHDADLDQEDISRILKAFNFDKTSSLFQAIGSGIITLVEIIEQYNKIKNTKLKISNNVVCDSKHKSDDNQIIGLPSLPILPVTCCCPVPGDKIVGLVFHGRGVEIHINKCKVLCDQEPNSSAAVIDLSWSKSVFSAHSKHVAKIFVTMICESGNLSKVAYIIEKQEAEIVNLKMGEKFENFIQTQIEMEVFDAYQVSIIMAEIRRLDFVSDVARR